MSDGEAKFDMFIDCLRRGIAPYAGRPEYGNLRHQIDVWQTTEGARVTNLALVYETPDGSPGQINVCFDYRTGIFSLIDDAERLTADIDEVIAWILPRVRAIAAIWRRVRKLPERPPTVH